MEMTKRVESGITFVAIAGRLDAITSSRFETFVNELSDEEIRKISVNCVNMEYISSAGLRVFLLLAKKSNAAQGKLVLHNLNSLVSNVFEVTGFSKILTIFKSEMEAKEALSS